MITFYCQSDAIELVATAMGSWRRSAVVGIDTVAGGSPGTTALSTIGASGAAEPVRHGAHARARQPNKWAALARLDQAYQTRRAMGPSATRARKVREQGEGYCRLDQQENDTGIKYEGAVTTRARKMRILESTPVSCVQGYWGSCRRRGSPANVMCAGVF